MNNQINIIVQNQVYILSRDLLISESENKQIKTSKDFTLPFPEWVTKQTYLLIEKYLKSKDVAFLKAYINQSETVVKVLRTADYLGMIRFHDKFINQVLIPNINHLNCLFLLEQSHKKLKNINDSQTWYNLLNMSIIYLSTHAYEVFRLNSQRFKKLNQKIVTQILQRVIRLERKKGFENKHMLYQLIIQCKEAQIGDISKLFEILRTSVKNKKIHSKIHAKLSWKLQNISQLNEKNTKNFKYLDMNWFLKANKVPEGLLVTLNLIPFQNQNFRSSQSEVSETTSQKSETSSKSFQISNKQNSQKNQNQQAYINDSFTKIGLFYSKVHWKFQQHAYQQDIKVYSILMNQSSSMQVILIDQKMQKTIGPQKVQLTIYCNTETIYTFLINYVFWHYDSLMFKPNNFCIDQLLILIKASKNIGNYSQALRISTQLINLHPRFKDDIQLSQGFDFSKMTKIQLQIYSTIFGRKTTDNFFTKIKNMDISPNVEGRGNQSQKRTISPIPITPINSIYKKVNFSNSSSQLNVNPTSLSNTPASNAKISSFNRTSSGRENQVNTESLTNSRGDSKGKRKIFNKPDSSEQDIREILLQQMFKVTDITRYLFEDPVRNPEYQKMAAVLKL